jgi:hypothetical protein
MNPTKELQMKAIIVGPGGPNTIAGPQKKLIGNAEGKVVRIKDLFRTMRGKQSYERKTIAWPSPHGLTVNGAKRPRRA